MIECVLVTYIKLSFSSKRILLCTKSSNFCKLMFEQILALQDTPVLPIHLTYLQAVLLTGMIYAQVCIEFYVQYNQVFTFP